MSFPLRWGEISNGATAVQLPLRGLVCLVREFGRIERSDVATAAVQANRRRAAMSRSAHTEKSSGSVPVWSPLVLRVLLRPCFTQIRPSVVGPIAVDVIDLLIRPFPRHVEPREAMQAEMLAADWKVQIALSVVRANSIASTTTIAVNQSCESSAFWAVVEQATQNVGRER